MNRFNFDKKIEESVKEIISGSKDTTWVVFGVKTRNDKDMKFLESGDDYEEMVEEFTQEPSMLLFGLHRYCYENCDKFVYFSWCHKGYPKKQDFIFVDRDVQGFLKSNGGYHVKYIAHDEEDFETENVEKEIKRCAGASYMDESKKKRMNQKSAPPKPIKKAPIKKAPVKKTPPSKPVKKAPAQPIKKIAPSKPIKKSPPSKPVVSKPVKKATPPSKPVKKATPPSKPVKKATPPPKKKEVVDEIKKETGYSEKELTSFVESVEKYVDQMYLRIMSLRLEKIGLLTKDYFKGLTQESEKVKKLEELIQKLEKM